MSGSLAEALLCFVPCLRSLQLRCASMIKYEYKCLAVMATQHGVLRTVLLHHDQQVALVPGRILCLAGLCPAAPHSPPPPHLRQNSCNLK